ncbi:hypothetical protein CCUS01_00135 [Colletotrichum cuscutae]|uniref:Uncharacterized protein n=1 Tax=Colletotrichum cuscutae TaxID=1209917 RepID=A0AAJ0DQR2_9PEZI|nr:hypothetical protein CCUS01_00135 [Colletotrichum cuscutae]
MDTPTVSIDFTIIIIFKFSFIVLFPILYS